MTSKVSLKLYGDTRKIFECCSKLGMSIPDLEKAILKVVSDGE